MLPTLVLYSYCWCSALGCRIKCYQEPSQSLGMESMYPPNHMQHYSGSTANLSTDISFFPQSPIAVQFAWAAILSGGMVRLVLFLRASGAL
jgi:hypothetical protein